MNQVITHEQGRAVLGGREPFGIIEYEQAVALLRQCLTIDDAKRFATFADAKAAWGKVAHNDEVIRLGRALKLEAGRRMAQLAEKERPTRQGGVRGGRTIGSSPGARSLLVESGLTPAEATAALKLTRLPEPEFQSILSSPKPPALSTIRGITDWSRISTALGKLFWVVETYAPSEALQAFQKSERNDVSVLRKQVVRINEWTDEILQRLPKE